MDASQMDQWVEAYLHGGLAPRDLVLLLAKCIDEVSEEDIRYCFVRLARAEPSPSRKLLGTACGGDFGALSREVELVGRALERLSLQMSADLARAGTFGLPFAPHAERVAQLAQRLSEKGAPTQVEEPREMRQAS